MVTRVIVNGALGKMGSLACETLKNHHDFEVVGQLTRHDNLAKAIEETQAQIVIELTRADCVFENSLIIVNQGAKPVIGASGLTDTQIKELIARCQTKKIGGIIAPNFSIGAILMMNFAAQAAKYLTEVEIIETHHQQKLDSPSGTALKTAEMIAASRTRPKHSLSLKELVPGARGCTYHDINIHSLRLPGFLASQQVIFGNKGESLTISHNSIDRSCFMPGIVLACQKVIHLDQLIYGLEHLL